MHLLAHVINEWLTILIFSLVDRFLRGERGGVLKTGSFIEENGI